MMRYKGHYLAKSVCAKCSAEWTFEVDVEYGITNYSNNDDTFCPECGFETNELELGDRL